MNKTITPTANLDTPSDAEYRANLSADREQALWDRDSCARVVARYTLNGEDFPGAMALVLRRFQIAEEVIATKFPL